MKKLLIIVFFVFFLSANSYACIGNYPGGFCYTGLGGPAYDGLGGPCYDGLGGPAYSGIGGPCHKTSAGFTGNCPEPCRCKACKKSN